MKVSVVGTGYVGLVTSACLADTGNHITAIDVDEAKIEKLRRGESPIYEPGLDKLLQSNIKAGRLRFTTDLAEGIRDADVTFIAVGTPPNADGSSDLSALDAVADQIARIITEPKVLVIKSTVPVGTAQRIEDRVNAKTPHRVSVVSNPEFLKEGYAVEDFEKPDRVIIGADDPRAGDLVRELYIPFVRNQHPILQMGRTAAEMSKYASNAYLATRISFINEIANLCDRLGVDVQDVRRGMGTDQRIGFQFLYPGAGYGGSCFPKDVRSLAHLSREAGVEPEILNAVHHVNERQKRIIFEKIRKRFGDHLDGRVFAFWGVTFKARTDDIREAPALATMDALQNAGASIRAHDPQGLDNLRAQNRPNVACFEDAYECLDGADALVIMTEWSEFRSPDFAEIKKRLAHPVIFDGRNLYEPDTIRRHALEYYAIGRPSVRPPA